MPTSARAPGGPVTQTLSGQLRIGAAESRAELDGDPTLSRPEGRDPSSVAASESGPVPRRRLLWALGTRALPPPGHGQTPYGREARGLPGPQVALSTQAPCQWAVPPEQRLLLVRGRPAGTRNSVGGTPSVLNGGQAWGSWCEVEGPGAQEGGRNPSWWG